MRQVTMTQFLLRLSMPWVAFCLVGVLGGDTVPAPAIVALWIWVAVSVATLAIPSWKSAGEVMDLAGSLILTALSGWTSSPFVPVLLLVIALSGARNGSRRAMIQASLAVFVLVAGSLSISSAENAVMISTQLMKKWIKRKGCWIFSYTRNNYFLL